MEKYWSIRTQDLLNLLHTSTTGLTSDEAEQRLRTYGKNVLTYGGPPNWFHILAAQYKSPIVLILIFAAATSLFLHDLTDALIILVIITASGLLSF